MKRELEQLAKDLKLSDYKITDENRQSQECKLYILRSEGYSIASIGRIFEDDMPIRYIFDSHPYLKKIDGLGFVDEFKVLERKSTFMMTFTIVLVVACTMLILSDIFSECAFK